MESNKTVLIVEDENSLRRAVSKKFEYSEVSTRVASSVKEALEILNNENDVRAVWLDHYLGEGETGIDLLKQIRVKENLKELPVFVVTNTADNDKKKEYMDLNIENFFIKADSPIDDIVKEVKEKM